VVTLKELITGLLEHEQKTIEAKKKKVEEWELTLLLFLYIFAVAFLAVNNKKDVCSIANVLWAIKIERYFGTSNSALIMLLLRRSVQQHQSDLTSFKVALKNTSFKRAHPDAFINNGRKISV
jgi:hypothetical protein